MIDRLKSIPWKQYKWVIAAGGIGVSCLLFKLISSMIQNNSKKKKANQSQQAHQHPPITVRANSTATTSIYSQYYFDKQQELRKAVHKLSPSPTLQELYLLSPHIIVDQFMKYTAEIRHRRRLIRKVNEDAYTNLIVQYQSEIDLLFVRGRAELADEVGILEDGIQKMQNAWQVIDDVRGLNRNAKAVLAGLVEGRTRMRQIPDKVLQKIVDEELSFLNGKMYSRLHQKLLKNSIQQHHIYPILFTLRDDIIYEKYGYEREEIESELRGKALGKQLRKVRELFFREIVEGEGYKSNENSSQSEQQQSQIGKSLTKTKGQNQMLMPA